MNRQTLTAIVKANKGKIVNSSANHVNYKIHMSEEKFIAFRKTIPFLNIWQTGTDRTQTFGVFFNKFDNN